MSSTIANATALVRAHRLISNHPKTVVFVTTQLRAREIGIAGALRQIGWKVVLIFQDRTPFKPEGIFDVIFRVNGGEQALNFAKNLQPRICHIFSGAIDSTVSSFCLDKPSPVVVDLNDIFAPSLMDHCEERFEPTRECLQNADALCARDLQAKFAERLDGWKLPKHVVLFPEYPQASSLVDSPRAKFDRDELHVVSVGTICLESQGHYDSGHLRLAEMFAAQGIHFHLYPHWGYHDGGIPNGHSLEEDFADYLALHESTGYVHVHNSLSLPELRRVLPSYDFGIVSGGKEAFGQAFGLLKPPYMQACFSGRISDFITARLPVLINSEVAFNHWLLKRYGICVELDAILEPGFRDLLSDIKHSDEWARRMDNAARVLTLEGNIARLATFYERVALPHTTARDLDYPELVRIGMHKIARGFVYRIPVLKHYLPGEFLVGSLKESLSAAQQANKQLQRHSEQLESELLTATDSNEKLEVANKRLQALNDRYMAQGLGLSTTVSFAEMSGLLNWAEATDVAEQQHGFFTLQKMISLYVASQGELSESSKCWDVLNFKHQNQLIKYGYANFKRTLGFNYFTFLVQGGDRLISVLEAALGEQACAQCRRDAEAITDDPAFDCADQATYRYYVLLLWSYACSVDTRGYLSMVKEPTEGNPVTVPVQGVHASQDIANSMLEYYSITEAVDISKCRRVLEIGGGYGRDAFFTLQLNSHIQYVMVDIPPALYVAQRYLCSVYPEREAFHVQDFSSYEDVKEQLSAAKLVFLLPHQLELLPDKYFDLALNISSFAEMTKELVAGYFDELERVTAGYFYSKQWKVSQNAFDELTILEDDYPIPSTWKELYRRQCSVQEDFFEAMYEVA